MSASVSTAKLESVAPTVPEIRDRTHMNNVCIRLRDLAATLADEGLTEAAEHTSRAYGSLLGVLAASSRN